MTPEALQSLMSDNGVSISDSQLEQLKRWAILFAEWNHKINLISRKDLDQLWEHHVLTSLSLLTVASLPTNKPLCDLGTGGGLPGVLLAIVLPETQWVLMDARQKKIKVVSDLVEQLQLPNVEALWGRSEDIGQQPKYHKKFSVITAKAVSALENLHQWSQPLRNSKATLYAYKGGDLSQEIKDFRRVAPKTKIIEHPLPLKGYSRLMDDQKKIVEVRY